MSDDNPWAHYPNNPDAIKRHNELVLSSISTADLVNELASREETTVYEVEKGQQCSIQIDNEVVDFTNHMPPAWILEVIK